MMLPIIIITALFILTLILLGRPDDGDVSEVGVDIKPGGLGNFLFFIAFAIGLNRPFCLHRLDQYVNPHTQNRYGFIQDRVRNHTRFRRRQVRVRKMVTETDPYIFTDFSNETDCIFVGYFQTDRYFLHVREEIVRVFSEPESIAHDLDRCRLDFENSMYIHVRLTDYLNHPQHMTDPKYYSLAMRHIPVGINKLYIFSDDPANALKYLPADPLGRYNIVHNFDEVQTLYAMARFKRGGIGANSSLSWWGMWLNPSESKLTILPKKWYAGTTYPDIYSPTFRNLIVL